MVALIRKVWGGEKVKMGGVGLQYHLGAIKQGDFHVTMMK